MKRKAFRQELVLPTRRSATDRTSGSVSATIVKRRE